MAGAPPQQSPQITHPPSQQTILPHKIPPLPEARFKSVFIQFTAATGIRLTESDLTIEGRPINLWALHKAVFLRNGFETVCLGMNDSVVSALMLGLGMHERRVADYWGPFGIPSVLRRGCRSAWTLRACGCAPATTVI
jgi:hypothetical protein